MPARTTKYDVLGLRGNSEVVGTPTVKVYQRDENDKVTRASGTTVPSDGDAGYATGAIFTKTNGGVGTVNYINEGTSTSADFNAVGGPVVEARTATASGATTGTISAGTTHVTVTSANADHIIILPPPVVGHQIVLHVGANGYELRSSSPTTIAINGGTGADAESAIAANSTCFMTCVSATAWKGFFLDADSDVAKVEAAA